MKRTINYCGTPTNVASKFILISVCDGNIDTFHFYNFNDAVDEMLGQLWVVYMGAGQDRNKWESIKREEQYSANGFGFEINRDSFEYTSAWCNFDGRPYFTWAIEEVTFNLD